MSCRHEVTARRIRPVPASRRAGFPAQTPLIRPLLGATAAVHRQVETAAGGISYPPLETCTMLSRTLGMIRPGSAR